MLGLVSCRTGSALALLYGTSATLEHHHFNHAVMILQSEVRSSLLEVFLSYKATVESVASIDFYQYRKKVYKHAQLEPLMRVSPDSGR